MTTFTIFALLLNLGAAFYCGWVANRPYITGGTAALMLLFVLINIGCAAYNINRLIG